MKKLSIVAICTLAVCSALSAACTLTVNGVEIGSDAGRDAEAVAPSDSGATGDAAMVDGGNVFTTCAECGAALCAGESTTCNTVQQGVQSSPCKGYSDCLSTCTGTKPEKTACESACGQAYPEADALYTCLENKCTLSCISN